MSATKSLQTIIAAGTSTAAGATTTGTTLDLRTAYGAFVTGNLTNGTTAPTAVPFAIFETSGDNVNWDEVYRTGGDLIANSVTPLAYEFVFPVMYGRVRVTGNAGQAVTSKALAQVALTI